MTVGAIADQRAYSDERRRLLLDAQRAVRDRLPAPSDVAHRGGTPREVAAAREAMREALEAAERDVDEQLAPVREAQARARREQRDAQAADEQAVQRARDEQLARDAVEVPTELRDDLTADEQLADLERRVAAGDESVTVEQLAAAREAAAGRRRFAQLRDVADRRRREREAAEVERQRVERVEAAAVEHLDAVSPVLIAERYDAARAAVEQLVEVLDARVATVARLARAGGDERLPGAVPAWSHSPIATVVEVDGVRYAAGDAEPDTVVGGLLRSVGVYAREGGRVSVEPRAVTDDDRREPALVAQGRSEAASAADTGAAGRRRAR